MKAGAGYLIVGFMLLIAASIFLYFGLWKLGMIKFDKSFLYKTGINIGPLAVLSVALLTLVYVKGKTESVQLSLMTTARMTTDWMPMLLVMFLSMGAALTVIDFYKASIIPFLAGKHGLFGSWLASIIMPGSLGSIPVVNKVWAQSPQTHSAIIMFLANSMLIGWQAFLIRGTMLDWNIAKTMVLMNVVYSLLIWGFTWLIVSLGILKI